MKLLLVEPNFPSRFPNLGLMKLSTYYKSKGWEVKFAKGNHFTSYVPDRICISTLFTYEAAESIKCIKYYQQLYPKSEIIVGGIFATLMPRYIEQQTGVKPFIGLLPDNIENAKLDYSIYPDTKESYIFTSRGCIRKCQFCAVPIHEPKFIVKEDWLEKQYNDTEKIVFMDNNYLAKPIHTIEQDLSELGGIEKLKSFSFNQGLDARIFSETFLKGLKLYNLIKKIKPLYLSWDSKQEDEAIPKAINKAKEFSISASNINIYMLWNFNETPQEIWHRMNILNQLKVNIYPMRYSPLTDISRKYISDKWEKLAYWNYRNKVGSFVNGCIGCGLSRERFEFLFGKDKHDFISLLHRTPQNNTTMNNLKKQVSENQGGLFG